MAGTGAPGLPTFRVDAPLSPLHRRHVVATARLTWDADVDFAPRVDTLDQALDTATAAALAAVVLELISLIVQLAEFHESTELTVDRVEALIREEAAKELGTAAVANLRHTDLREFIDGSAATCLVTAEIDDEDYLFIVSRDGGVVVFALQA